VRLWELLTGKETQRLEGGSSVCSVAFSPDNEVLASGSAHTTIRLSGTTKGAQGRLEGHTKQVNVIAFSPDGKAVASGTMDQTVILWEVATGKTTHKLQGHYGSVFAIAFSPDSSLVASGSGDNTVRLWDVATGMQRHMFEGHTGEITVISFSPYGKMVASGSDDKTVRLWDAAASKELQVHRTLKPVSRITFSDDGTSLETDAGHLDLGISFGTHGKLVTKPHSTLGVESSWVTFQGTNFVWLPHEYRASCHDASGSNLVIGHASGAVSFLSAV
jgi:WD40 repeat protein